MVRESSGFSDGSAAAAAAGLCAWEASRALWLSAPMDVICAEPLPFDEEALSPLQTWIAKEHERQPGRTELSSATYDDGDDTAISAVLLSIQAPFGELPRPQPLRRVVELCVRSFEPAPPEPVGPPIGPQQVHHGRDPVAAAATMEAWRARQAAQMALQPSS
mmetsp:Transcript_165570/g.526559  ORF Transcript_165570/g.526559 Transcript_165570/m.526559 type:complete len:162 (-) Transcript_165570:49-534(-)